MLVCGKLNAPVGQLKDVVVAAIKRARGME
jgi:hypothetical protein